MTRYKLKFQRQFNRWKHGRFCFLTFLLRRALNSGTKCYEQALKKKVFKSLSPYLRVSSEQLKGLVHLPLFDTSPQIQEVSWLSSMQVDDVTCGHGQTGSIH